MRYRIREGIHTVAYLLLAAVASVIPVACSGSGTQPRLYRDVAAWLDVNALSTEILAIPPDQRVYFKDRTLVEVPTDRDAFAILEVLDVERPDYVLAANCVAWDGVLAQPWFRARYREVQTWTRAELAGSPFTLFVYQPAPLDGAAVVPTAARFETPSVVLRGFALSSSRVVPGEPLHLVLYWDDLPSHNFSNLIAVVRLVGSSDGDVWGEVRGRLRPSGLTWAPEARLAGQYTLTPPDDLREGDYALEVSLVTGDGRTIPVASTSDSVDEHLSIATVSHPPDVARVPIPMDYRTDHRFGEAIDLIGYNAPQRAEPGDQIRVTLLWHAREEVPGDYTVFVHVLEESGVPVAQGDAKPVYWFYPTTAWEAGDYVRDEHVLTLPSELQRGDYRISVGLYDGETGNRLPVLDERSGAAEAVDHIVLHSLAVR